VPDKLAQRLIAAGEALEAARVERDAAVIAALRAGGSTREVGALVGLTGAAVHLIGKAHGWPDEQELQRRERMRTPQGQYDRLEAEIRERQNSG
jgi:hypothetical protein